MTPTLSWSSGTPNCRPYAVDPVDRDAEEAGAEPTVDGRQQDGHAGHAGVDEPVRRRPAVGVAVGPPLVRLGVAVQVGLPAGPYKKRTGAVRMPRSQPDLVIAASAPALCQNAVPLGAGVEHEQRDTLGEPRRRSPQGRSRGPPPATVGDTGGRRRSAAPSGAGG